MPEVIEDGRVAYESYREAWGERSLLSSWDGLTEPVREAWRAVADAVVMFRSFRGRDLIYPPKLTSELRDILGRPSFACGPVAERLRRGGWKIATKAEHEQAAVIHFCLTHYLRDAVNWAENADGELAAMVANGTEGATE
jgi:hypothetical protein